MVFSASRQFSSFSIEQFSRPARSDRGRGRETTPSGLEHSEMGKRELPASRKIAFYVEAEEFRFQISEKFLLSGDLVLGIGSCGSNPRRNLGCASVCGDRAASIKHSFAAKAWSRAESSMVHVAF